MHDPRNAADLGSADDAPLIGQPMPRIGPDLPELSIAFDEYVAAAEDLGIDLMPWQLTAAAYMTATRPPLYAIDNPHPRQSPDEQLWLWVYVCIIAARQNGKTTLLLPYIWQHLRRGRRLLHTAQNRILPKETFDALDDLVGERDEVRTVRRANGQESITMRNGGRYKIVAPNRGTRGLSADHVIIDEVREQRDMQLQGRINPTITASQNPQVLYLSNAGSEDSVVLNDIRHRRDSDPTLCYLEWSAAPGRSLDDRDGWAEANPALGHTIQPWLLESFRQSETPATFETERLCRWVLSMQPKLVDDGAWGRARVEGQLPSAVRPMLGISMAADAQRASAVLAWQLADGRIAVRLEADVTGDPIDTDKLGRDLQQRSLRLGVTTVAYDDSTDRDLARYFAKRAKPLVRTEFANACEFFTRALDTGRIVWSDDGTADVAQDLAWSTRQDRGDDTFEVGRASDERSIPSTLAAIRAVWLASVPKAAAPRVL
jgi:hypothetical protein